ncbi:hypothetical protein [Parabacteroides distasonis]|uniref:hypothetical protein n=1 Tax=Parabacteroides distasonis TaxID=823 RepID=UPI00280482CF|nr:hypothetical protein [Parabacteroides distasonis]WMI43695.1 hypothetical protein Q8809_05025 [Parabacteroides distasonis]
MSYELGIPADIRGKASLSLGRPQRTGVKRRDRSEREEHPCLSEASWDATASVGLEVARQRQP